MRMKAYKYRLFPTKSQIHTLEETLDKCRWVYNKTLEYRKKIWEKEQKSLSKYDTYNQLTKWKQKNEFLDDAYTQILRESQERVDLAFRAFFRRVKRGEKPGYPRFKKKDRYHSFTHPQITSNFRFIDDNHINLPKIGVVRLKRHRPIDGRIKRITIRRYSTGKWFIIFSVKYQSHPSNWTGKAIGIDVGLRSFATLSDGQKIDNPRFMKQEEKNLKKSYQKLGKTKKGSKERTKARKILSRVYERINNRRHNFIHQTSRRIVDNFDLICVEKLQIEKLKQKSHRSQRRSIQDVAWSMFFNSLVYKAGDADKLVIQINPAYTTQTCSRCERRKKLDLKDETYQCDRCGLSMDRDENAAINVLRLGSQSLGSKDPKSLVLGRGTITEMELRRFRSS